ncbi:hypothetical protein [Fibrobacter sp.]|uniref:hypothetical protein n=1 Tax=Fibrobacter sp. TaxID=35828 RepID=UPI00386E6AD9
MIKKLKHWFLKPGNELLRSVVCFISMVGMVIDILWVFSMPSDEFTTATFIGITSTFVLLFISWAILSYIIEHDS